MRLFSELINGPVKLQMIAVLLILATASTLAIGMRTHEHVITAVLVTQIVSLAIKYYKTRTFTFSQDALISGLIIGLVMNPGNLPATTLASALAIAGKYAVRLNNRKFFNPAASGMLAAFILMGARTSWWGSASVLALPLAAFIAYRIGKLPLMASFIIAHAAIIFSMQAYGSQPLALLPLLLDNVTFFFAGIMLVEPKTSTALPKAMIVQGAATAAAALAFFTFMPGIDHYLAGLLAVNVFVDALNKRIK